MMTESEINRDHYQLEIFAKLASAFVISVGIFVLLCWVFNLWMPSAIKSYLPLIPPNTAFCFILSGFSLWLHVERENSYTYHIAIVCAATVFLLGSLTLFEHFFNINLGIDARFFRETAEFVLPNVPAGRMSPLTATNFVLIGCSLLFLNSKVLQPIVQQVFVAIVIILTFLQLLGYIYKLNDADTIFGIHAHHSQLPLLTILTFLIISVGILCVRSGSGILSIFTSKYNGGIIARRLIPPAILLPIIVGYLVSLGGKWVGFSEAELGVSILVTTTIIVFSAIVALNAFVVDKADMERKEVEKELKLNQIKLKAVLDNTSALVFIQDIEGRYLLVNKQFEKLFHKAGVEIINQQPAQVMPEDDAKKAISRIQKVVRARSPVVIEDLYPNDDGEIHSYVSNYFPLFTDQNVIYAVGCISTDITALNKVNAALKENQERLVLALQSADAGVWSWDIPKDIITWDEHMYKLFGMKLGSFSGSSNAWLNLIHPDDRTSVSDQINNTLELGNELKVEFRNIHQDGSIHYLADRGKLFYDESGHPLRMTGVCWDMTERKKAEIDLQAAKETAEELAEKAEEASRVKSAFLAAMSHEIRTPLNGVIGMTGLLRDTSLSEEQHEYIETIRVSGELLLSVINDILDFSKIGSGQMKIEKLDFNLYSLVDESIEIIAPQIHNKGVAIGAYIQQDVPEWLVGDAARIRQVLGNLLNNAAKFTERGEICLKIKVLKKNDKIITLLFEVLDTGIGIDHEKLEHIFQPFTQGDISTSRKYGGTGLGLAISKRIIELMGGTISVDSIQERGSRFSFTVEFEESTKHVETIIYEPVPELFGKPILCVDDNSINREIIKRQLDNWKLHCDLAMDAGDALSMMRKAVANNEPYALVLVDYLMPGMDGIELIQIMRQLDGLEKIPAVLLMSLGTVFDMNEFEKLNIQMVLSKPIRQAKLYEAVTSLLSSHKIPIRQTQSHDFSDNMDLKSNKNYKVLLVEDNIINQQVALRILKKLGFNADVASNGKKALEFVKKRDYDIIFMDCQMPEMDGYTATKKIREQESQSPSPKHVPIIAMTAYALKGDKEKCVNAGMDDYISKPFHIKTLTQVIEIYLLKEKLFHNDINQKPESESSNPEHNIDTVIDLERLHDIFGHDNPGIANFLREFVTSSENIIAKIKESLEEDNSQAVKDYLHQLKGSSGNSGVVQVHILSKQAEEKARNNELESVKSLLSLIENAMVNLQNELSELDRK